MDAISFVLGVDSYQLRSNNLVDLINRRSDAEIATPLTTGNGKKRTGVVKEQGANRTVVSAFYVRSDNEELIFSRR